MSSAKKRRGSQVNKSPVGEASTLEDSFSQNLSKRFKNAAGIVNAADHAKVQVGDHVTIQGGTSISIYNQYSHDQVGKFMHFVCEMTGLLDDYDNTSIAPALDSVLWNTLPPGDESQGYVTHSDDTHMTGTTLDTSGEDDAAAVLEELLLSIAPQVAHATPSAEHTNNTATNIKITANKKQRELLRVISRYIQRQESCKSIDPADLTASILKQPTHASSLLEHFKKIFNFKKEEYEDKIRDSIRNWLYPRQYIEDEPQPTEGISGMPIIKPIDGTCNWILERQELSDWLSANFPSNAAKLLWISGPAGYGKTLLTTRVLGHLISTLKKPIGFLFLSSSMNGGNPFTAMRVWLHQILSHPAVLHIVQPIWKAKRKHTLSQPVITEIFKTVVMQIPDMTFILDGLDECGNNQSAGWQTGDEVIKTFLSTIWESIKSTKTRILLTSREKLIIRQNLPSERMVSAGYIVSSEYVITLDDVQSDVNVFAQSIVDERLDEKDDESKKRVVKQMSDRCEGQFLWLKFLKKSLRGYYDEYQLTDIIAKAPKEMHGVYTRHWKAILQFENNDVAKAVRTLRWVAFSLRPLTVREIADAIRIEPDKSDLPPKNALHKIEFGYMNYLLEICGDLVETRGISGSKVADRTVHLPHHSVKEFLLQATITIEGENLDDTLEISLKEEKEHAKLTRSCLQYLNFPSTWDKPLPISNAYSSTSAQAFRGYASSFWHNHLLGSEENCEETIRAVNRFFAADNSAWDAWERWLSETEAALKVEGEALGGNRLHYACRLGLSQTVRLLLKQNPSIMEIPTQSGRTGLWIACAMGHTDIVETLISANAELNKACKNNYTPIHAASLNGHLSVIKMLLDVTTSNVIPDGTCLCLASGRGHLQVVRFLLGQGVDMSIRVHRGYSALTTAANAGHLDVVRLLVEHGMDVSITDDSNSTPLHHASSKGYFQITKLLLERGALVDALEEEGLTPLHIACYAGHLDIVQLLIGYNAQPNSHHNEGFAPIHMAAAKDHVEILDFLLSHGLGNRTKTKDGRIPLHLASSGGCLNTVELLLKRNNDVGVACHEGLQPLHYAAGSGNVDIIRILVENQADVLAQANYGQTTLFCAAFYGHLEASRLLIRLGANLTSTYTNVKSSEIFVACQKGYTDIVRLLLSHISSSGSQHAPIFAATWHSYEGIVDIPSMCNNAVNTAIVKGITLLHIASQNGFIDIARLLIDHGANVNAQSDEGFTPLHLAAGASHTEIVQLLLENQANITITTFMEKFSAIHIAAMQGNDQVMRLMLKHKTDLDLCTRSGETLLHAVSSSGNYSLAYMLLQHGANPMKVDSIGRLPMHIAISHSYIKLVRLFIDYSAIDASSIIEDYTPSLIYAVMMENVDIIEILLEHTVDVTKIISCQLTAVHFAIKTNNMEILRLLIKHSAAAIARDVSYLAFAISGSCTEAMSLLIENGADVTAKLSKGFSVLQFAIATNKIEAVRLLISKNVLNNTTDSDGKSIIFTALDYGHVDIIAFLLDTLWDDYIRETDHEPILQRAMIRGNVDVVFHLIKKGISSSHISGDNALLPAVALNSMETLRLLIERSRELAGSLNERMVLVAVALGNEEILQFLMKRSAKIANKSTSQGQKLLHAAICQGQVGSARVLIQHGMEVDTVDEHGETPLHAAVLYGKPEMICFLIEHGASVTARDNDGLTPMHSAANAGHAEVIRILTSYEPCAIMADDNERCQPIHYAVDNGHIDAVRLLLELGADVTTTTSDGTTLALLAASTGDIELLQLLLDKGADASQSNKSGYTPLMAAAACGDVEAVKLLLREAESTIENLDKFQRSAFFYATARGHSVIGRLLAATSCKTVDIADYTGMTASERASHHGHGAVIAEIGSALPNDASMSSISDRTLNNLTSIDEEDDENDDENARCVVCIQNFDIGSTYYLCPTCSYHICPDCFKENGRCVDQNTGIKCLIVKTGS